MYGIFTFPENPETNIASKKGLLQSNHWFSGDMLVAGSVLTFLGLKKISMGKPSRCNNFSNGSALYNIWGDDFALWSLEFLQRKKVLGGHTEPCPRVPWWWPFRGDPPHSGSRGESWWWWICRAFFFSFFGVFGETGISYRKKITMKFLGLQKISEGAGIEWMRLFKLICVHFPLFTRKPKDDSVCLLPNLQIWD